MFGLFKSKKEKLQKKHRDLLKQAYQWSSIDRRKSDELYAKADQLQAEISGGL